MYTDMQISGPAQSAERIAYEYLRDEILSGRLPGGSPVRQEAVAAHLGVSRIPVRDAIAHLAASGLVTYEANRRVIVTVLKEKDLLELFEMRAVLVGLAARHAAPHLGADDLSQLTWLAARMDQTETAEDKWIPIHYQFHEVLCQRAGMPRLLREIVRLRQAVEPYVRVLISLHGAAELGTSRHDSLVEGIRNRDPDRAEQLVREHILEASRQIIATIRSSRTGSGAQPPDLPGAATTVPSTNGARPKATGRRQASTSPKG
jgi:DNA-binding GntR family transcriptional regulator